MCGCYSSTVHTKEEFKCKITGYITQSRAMVLASRSSGCLFGQTWQTSLEHYYVYVQTCFLSKLRKMLILLISSYCKMCTLPTLRSRVFVCCEQYKDARSYCRQWTHFTMGPNEQNQHFAELRQKICLHIYVVVLLTCLPSLDGKLERFVTKKWEK